MKEPMMQINGVSFLKAIATNTMMMKSA